MFHLADSGFGNILYIVFGILYFIYQAYSAGKKKDKKPTPKEEYETDAETETPASFETIFDKMRELERSFKRSETVQTVSEPIKTEPRVKYKSIQRKTPITLIPTDLDEESADDSSSYQDQSGTLFREVTLKDAVIGAEILKRPEW
jgi:hypothetical protein